MYIVTIKNGTKTRKLQDRQHKLSSGNIVKGINSIDSLTFSVLPSNPCFDLLHDFTTLVEVFNTSKNRYEFYGRVLCSSPSMSESGLIKKDVTCESFFGFLCDSQQAYVAEKNWTVAGLVSHIINTHNSQVEDYKRFRIGQITVTDPNDNVYIGIQRKNTWDTIKEKLIDKLGGEIRFRVVDGVIYFDYLQKIGVECATEIALSRNMKAITKEKDPSAYVTRLIPLGAKLSEDGEERLDITSVNGGKNYIDDVQAIAEYGLHIGYVEFDDVTEPMNLMSKGRKWLEENNKVLIKYSITALDLSLIGLDIDDFEVHNYYPIKNRLLGIDDVARIIKKNINICEETKTTIEIGESFKTLSDIQREQYDNLKKINADIQEIKKDYVTNEVLIDQITKTQSLISQQEEEIVLRVSAECVTITNFNTYKESTAAELKLKVGIDENDRIVSMLNASADIINITSDRLTIDSTYFKLFADGTIRAYAGQIGGCNIFDGVLQVKNANIAEKITADKINANGISAIDVDISGKLTSTEGKLGNVLIGSSGLTCGSITLDGAGVHGSYVWSMAGGGTLATDSVSLTTAHIPELTFTHAEEGGYESKTIMKAPRYASGLLGFIVVGASTKYSLYLDMETNTVKFREGEY